MQVLVFVVRGLRLAVPAGLVTAVVQRVALRPIMQAPRWLPGLLDYHGSLMPVVDAALLCAGSASDAAPVPATVGSRILLLDVPGTRDDGSAGSSRFGLLVERVLDRAEIDFAARAWRPGAALPELDFLDAVGSQAGETVQLLEPRRLVQRERLLAPAAISPLEVR